MADHVDATGVSPERTSSKEAARTHWNLHATRFVKAAMARAGVSYKELAALLHKDDPSTTDSAETLMKRINRGNFTMAFCLRVLRVLDTPSLDISYIRTDAERRSFSGDGHQNQL